MDNTEKAQEAIRSLNPLWTLRYSATHRNPYNLVYKLDPIRAYGLRLVKQIVVGGAKANEAFNSAYVRLKSIDYGKGKRPTAKIVIHANASNGVRERELKVKGGEDLHFLSNERAAYRDGFQITEINAEPGNECIQLSNGQRLHLGQEMGGLQEDVWKVQIRETVEKHLKKEKEVQGKGIKVLSLFFIDRVANYRSYDPQGNPVEGKFALAFEEALREITQRQEYRGLLPFQIERLHNGYFAQDKKGILKESREGRITEADEDVFSLIMKDKERLLSFDEPLRFIFSHSALREGWDSPNVFQICTLNESRSALRKRQEIGRGLRLPVNQQGERVFDENVNRLTIIANESYEDFARALQTEYEEDCGVTFGKVPKLAFSKLLQLVDGEQKTIGRETSEQIWNSLVEKGFVSSEGKILPKFNPKDPSFSLELPVQFDEVKADIVEVLESFRLEKHIKKDEDARPLRLNKQVYLDPEFEKLWNRIKTRTTYSVQYQTETLVTRAVKAIQEMDKITAATVSYSEAALDIVSKGVTAQGIRERVLKVEHRGPVPDIIAYLQSETELTRSTLVRILKDSGRLAEFLINPQRFMDAVAAILKRELHKLIVDGIKYEKLGDQQYEMRLFETKEIVSYLNSRVEVSKSVYDAVVYESEVEREFAEKLDRRTDVKLFVKLPYWFEIDTPLGSYNPDWAILKHDGTILYMVRETKGTKDFEKLRTTESEKLRCGRKHFEELGVDFAVVTSANEV